MSRSKQKLEFQGVIFHETIHLFSAAVSETDPNKLKDAELTAAVADTVKYLTKRGK